MKKVSEMRIEKIRTTYLIDGKEVEGVRVSESEMKEMGIELPESDCACGTQKCVGGHVWVCEWGQPCYWMKTPVYCNG